MLKKKKNRAAISRPSERAVARAKDKPRSFDDMMEDGVVPKKKYTFERRFNSQDAMSSQRNEMHAEDYWVGDAKKRLSKPRKHRTATGTQAIIRFSRPLI